MHVYGIILIVLSCTYRNEAFSFFFLYSGPFPSLDLLPLCVGALIWLLAGSFDTIEAVQVAKLCFALHALHRGLWVIPKMLVATNGQCPVICFKFRELIIYHGSKFTLYYHRPLSVRKVLASVCDAGQVTPSAIWQAHSSAPLRILEEFSSMQISLRLFIHEYNNWTG